MPFVANFVRIIHILFVLFMVAAPFTNNFTRDMYIIIVPFLFLHWWMNDDTCALTLMECKLRGVGKSESLMQQIVGPVYDPTNADPFRYAYMFLVWVYVVYYRQPWLFERWISTHSFQF